VSNAFPLLNSRNLLLLPNRGSMKIHGCYPNVEEPVIFEHIRSGGCQSYLLGCSDTRAACLIDPEISLLDQYFALANRDGLRIHYLIDTHTHADHFSGTRELSRQLQAPVVMHHASPASHVDMRLDDRELLKLGKLRIHAMHTPGHTEDSMCLQVQDRVFTGDTLLIGGTGRTDLPSGNAGALYDSLFNKLLRLEPELKVFPAHDYQARGHSTIGAELVGNPRLKKSGRDEFVAMMENLNLSMPTHITEALRINLSGGKSISQLLAEAAEKVPFMSLADLRTQLAEGLQGLIVLDVREREAYIAGHIPGARLLPRGQLELRVNEELPDPTRRILTCCEFGRISTLAAATLREIGFRHAIALDGGMKAWREGGFPLIDGE
jgi:glyoxylase-like metal-dependent hydrolase (beta-lactamase superfamily II)/rhodanese-related sulfurtransferase